MPVKNLHREPDFKAYAYSPVRDIPENMSWDCSLNQDVNLSADLHATMMNHMVKDEDGRYPEGKFDISTPNRAAHAYCRIIHPETGGVSSSKRIIWDVNFFNLWKWCKNLRESGSTVLVTRKESVRRRHAKRQEVGK